MEKATPKSRIPMKRGKSWQTLVFAAYFENKAECQRTDINVLMQNLQLEYEQSKK